MNNCEEKDCKYNTKNKGDLKRHLWQVHDIGKGDIYNCEEKDCEYNTKNKSHLKRHLSIVHDIGDKECQICYKNVSSLTKYKDKDKKEFNICRKCFNKATGYKTRPEKECVEYLLSIPQIGNYIVQKDKILKGKSCNTKRRPDLLLSSTDKLYIIIEIDEKQHKNNNYECENGRIDEILDEIPDGRVIIIRWNPDYYKPPTLENKKKNRKERLEMLKDLIFNMVNKKDWTDEETIILYYMFYSEDNPNITNRWNKKMIH